jgi:hypothetical protein
MSTFSENQVNIAYDMLLESTSINPDYICLSMCECLNKDTDTGVSDEDSDEVLLSKLMEKECNYDQWNETSIGNSLLFVRNSNKQFFKDFFSKELLDYLKYVQKTGNTPNFIGDSKELKDIFKVLWKGTFYGLFISMGLLSLK